MADKKPLSVFAKTEPEPKPETPTLGRRRRRDPSDPIQSQGVGLRASEWARLRAIADELGGVGLHELTVWAVRDFIRRYNAGEVKPETERLARLK